MRSNYRSGGVGIGVDLLGRAAEQIHESVQQRFRMVQPPRARPAVRSSENRGIAEGSFHALQFAGGERKRRLPIDRHERFGATARAIAVCAALQKALPDMRPVDAAAVIDGLCQRLRQRRRMLVFFKWRDTDHASVPDLRPIRSPMGCRSHEAIIHESLLRSWPAICLLSNYYDLHRCATVSNEVLKDEDLTRMNRFRVLALVFAFAIAFGALASPANAQSVVEFYRGK